MNFVTNCTKMVSNTATTISIIGEHNEWYEQVSRKLMYTNDLDYYKDQYGYENNLKPCRCSDQPGNEWRTRNVLIGLTVYARVTSRHCKTDNCDRLANELVQLSRSEIVLIVCDHRTRFDTALIEVYAHALKLMEIKQVVIVMNVIDLQVVTSIRNVFKRIDYEPQQFDCMDFSSMNDVEKHLCYCGRRQPAIYRGITTQMIYTYEFEYQTISGTEPKSKLVASLEPHEYNLVDLSLITPGVQPSYQINGHIVHDYLDPKFQWATVICARIYYSANATVFEHGSKLDCKHYGLIAIQCELFYEQANDTLRVTNRTYNVQLKFSAPIWFESLGDLPLLNSFYLIDGNDRDSTGTQPDSVCFGTMLAIAESYRSQESDLQHTIFRVFHAIRTDRFRIDLLESGQLTEHNFYDFMRMALSESKTDTFVCLLQTRRQRFQTSEDQLLISSMLFETYAVKRIFLDFEKLTEVFTVEFLFDALHQTDNAEKFFRVLKRLMIAMKKSDIINKDEIKEMKCELIRMKKNFGRKRSDAQINMLNIREAFFNHFVFSKMLDPHNRNKWFQLDTFGDSTLVRRLIESFTSRSFGEFAILATICSHYFSLEKILEKILREPQNLRALYKSSYSAAASFTAHVILNGNHNRNLSVLINDRTSWGPKKLVKLIEEFKESRLDDHETSRQLNAIYLLTIVDTIAHSKYYFYDEKIFYLFCEPRLRTYPFIRMLNSLEIIFYRAIILSDLQASYHPFFQTRRFDCLRDVLVARKIQSDHIGGQSDRTTINFYQLLECENFFELATCLTIRDLCPDWSDKLAETGINADAILFLKFLRFLFVEVIRFQNKLIAIFPARVASELQDRLSQFDVLCGVFTNAEPIKEFLLF